jgi:hypothetical protein
LETVRNKTVSGLILDAGIEVANLAKWPDSEGTQTAAKNTVKLLRKTFKEDSYPRSFLYLVMLQVAHEIYSDTLNRDIKNAGLKQAWNLIGELLD